MKTLSEKIRGLGPERQKKIGKRAAQLIALSAHIEEGYSQAERGELIEGSQARREIHSMKAISKSAKRGRP